MLLNFVQVIWDLEWRKPLILRFGYLVKIVIEKLVPFLMLKIFRLEEPTFVFEELKIVKQNMYIH